MLFFSRREMIRKTGDWSGWAYAEKAPGRTEIKPNTDSNGYLSAFPHFRTQASWYIPYQEYWTSTCQLKSASLETNWPYIQNSEQLRLDWRDISQLSLDHQLIACLSTTEKWGVRTDRYQQRSLHMHRRHLDVSRSICKAILSACLELSVSVWKLTS